MPYDSETSRMDAEITELDSETAEIDAETAEPNGVSRVSGINEPEPELLDAEAETLPAVRVDDLWVTFRATRESRQTLKGTLAGLRNRSKSSMLIQALRGVSFEVPAGSVYGVIGRNGAGKTTLFRTIAGILPPTYGRVTVWGHVTPLLSLGVGFNRELTGRENILLGGLTAGLSSEQVAEDAWMVEEFAGLGDAIDFPMRTYSSGMFGRLAFAVAAHLNPEILLIDEALAAGDAAFKLKCMDKISELCERDCTVMIVSHGLEVVRLLASRCVWIDRGQVRMEAPATDVISAYLADEQIDQADPTALEDF
ncbi:MAG: teichoic acid transport system ATP-binding protein [Actinomycetota bacterium]|nr:teichoic acid transport system ATP-binding protein [Actinomycetota bacterium]